MVWGMLLLALVARVPLAGATSTPTAGTECTVVGEWVATPAVGTSARSVVFKQDGTFEGDGPTGWSAGSYVLAGVVLTIAKTTGADRAISCDPEHGGDYTFLPSSDCSSFTLLLRQESCAARARNWTNLSWRRAR